MNRRTILAGVGSALCTSFAGCLATDSPSGHASTETPPKGAEDGDGNDDSETLESASEYPVNTGGLDEFDPERTDEAVDVGSRAGVDRSYRPHAVDIWNAAGVPAVDVRIVDSMDESVVLRETYELPVDTALSVSLLEPSNYRLEVRVPATGTRHTLGVPCRFFDCNGSVTRIGVFEGGRMRSSVISTTAACPSAACR